MLNYAAKQGITESRIVFSAVAPKVRVAAGDLCVIPFSASRTSCHGSVACAFVDLNGSVVFE